MPEQDRWAVHMTTAFLRFDELARYEGRAYARRHRAKFQAGTVWDYRPRSESTESRKAFDRVVLAWVDEAGYKPSGYWDVWRTVWNDLFGRGVWAEHEALWGNAEEREEAVRETQYRTRRRQLNSLIRKYTRHLANPEEAYYSPRELQEHLDRVRRELDELEHEHKEQG